MIVMMEAAEQIAAMFKALGDPTRIRLFELIRGECGSVAFGGEGDIRPVRGITVGEVCCQVEDLGQVRGNISYHLKELRNAGLINVTKQGKYRICTASKAAVELLGAFFAPEKCGACC